MNSGERHFGNGIRGGIDENFHSKLFGQTKAWSITQFSIGATPIIGQKTTDGKNNLVINTSGGKFDYFSIQ